MVKRKSDRHKLSRFTRCKRRHKPQLENLNSVRLLEHHHRITSNLNVKKLPLTKTRRKVHGKSIEVNTLHSNLENG